MTETGRVPDMHPKAVDIDDPTLLIDRVAYRDSRLLVAAGEPGSNLVAEVRTMTGHNTADLNRLRELVTEGEDPPRHSNA